LGYRCRGVGVSPGVAIGRAFVLHAESLPVVPSPIPPERVEEEVRAFERARARAALELRALRERVTLELGESYGGILEAQRLILEDPSLVQQTLQRIRLGRVSARWALKDVVENFARRFHAVEDDHLRDRGGDLSDVHRRLQRLLRAGPEPRRDLPQGPRIVVAHSLVPSDAVALADKGVAGLVTDVGGRTSHTAILAQALSVPAVAGVHDLSQRVRDGDPIIIDGTSGEVRHLPGPTELREAEARRDADLTLELAAGEGDGLARTRDGVEVVLRANIEFPGEVAVARRLGARGIGLYRSEFLFLSRAPHFPNEDEHFATYVAIGEAAAPHRAVIRTLDLGGEKYFHEVVEPGESNPVLGLRGVRLCLQRPEIFRPQLRGLLRAAARTRLSMLLPLVTDEDEIAAVRALLAREVAELRAAGHAAREDIPLGIMVEVPAAALAIDALARHVDLLSIGTNDLFQYALAVDRDNASVSYLYRPRHRGLLRLLRFVLRGAEQAGVAVSLCGELAADPGLTGLLIGLGLRELSMQPRALPTVRRTLARVDAAAERARVEALFEGSGRPGDGPGGACPPAGRGI